MNIFKTTGDILGCRDGDLAECSLHSFFTLAKQVRMQLGKRGYLLDNYLSLFFEAVNNSLTTDTSEEGMGSAETYQALCDQVLKNTDLQGGSPFAAKLGDILKEHPFISSFQESDTQRELLFAFAADIFLDEAVTQFFTEQKDSMSNTLDIIKLGDLYRQIEAIVGEPMAETLNLRLKQTFLIAPLAAVFRQAFTHSLLFKLTHRDSETSRQVFQLLLDNFAPPTEAGTSLP